MESFDQIERENINRIEQMDSYEIEKSIKEIYERLGRLIVLESLCLFFSLDPKTIEFLRTRSTQKAKGNDLVQFPLQFSLVSLFKQRAQKAKENAEQPDTVVEEAKSEAGPNSETNKTEFIKQLEVISDEVLTTTGQLNEYSRLAMVGILSL